MSSTTNRRVLGFFSGRDFLLDLLMSSTDSDSSGRSLQIAGNEAIEKIIGRQEIKKRIAPSPPAPSLLLPRSLLRSVVDIESVGERRFSRFPPEKSSREACGSQKESKRKEPTSTRIDRAQTRRVSLQLCFWRFSPNRFPAQSQIST